MASLRERAGQRSAPGLILATRRCINCGMSHHSLTLVLAVHAHRHPRLWFKAVHDHILRGCQSLDLRTYHCQRLVPYSYVRTPDAAICPVPSRAQVPGHLSNGWVRSWLNSCPSRAHTSTEAAKLGRCPVEAVSIRTWIVSLVRGWARYLTLPPREYSV